MSIQPASEMVMIGNNQPLQYQSQPSGNAITARVGPSFAIIPNIFGFTDGCGSPPLPQKMHMVPAPLPIDTPLAAKQLSTNVTNAHSQSSSAIQSFISQNMCLCFGPKGLLADQTYSDAQGVELFSFAMITPCCRHPRVTAFNAEKREIGHLRWNDWTCGMYLSQCLCSCLCRTASQPEFAYLSAVDANEQERLTFRNPAYEGECLLMKCCGVREHVNYGCCAKLPDIPFVKNVNIYGPMPQPGPVGSVTVRGAVGWDTACGCLRSFGARPELAIQYQLNPNLPFDETVLAIQMGLTVADLELSYRDYRTGQVHKLPFLKPADSVMQ